MGKIRHQTSLQETHRAKDTIVQVHSVSAARKGNIKLSPPVSSAPPLKTWNIYQHSCYPMTLQSKYSDWVTQTSRT